MNLTSLVFLGVLVLISILVIAAVVRPVHRMSRVAQAIAGGDLGVSLEHQSKDALGELADSIRDMQASLIRDIARREKAEADLIAAQGQIIQSEKMAVLGELVAGLAHELNTPLGTLASSADVVDRSRRIIEEKCRAGADLQEVTADPRFVKAIQAIGARGRRDERGLGPDRRSGHRAEGLQPAGPGGTPADGYQRGPAEHLPSHRRQLARGGPSSNWTWGPRSRRFSATPPS